ncbi:helix-turn-helix transcriptional regulator [uncultured Adlercreutzia sp.]|uniref:helix-turn-helix domain-containing protein n=1 Tax=uncultured Adlercreutzia sp. TaxID=875803 RepID=UPI00267482A9|nr:helix-turn-helix transcriptional regulator [uncultured Adlercreutzia sp.]
MGAQRRMHFMVGKNGDGRRSRSAAEAVKEIEAEKAEQNQALRDDDRRLPPLPPLPLILQIVGFGFLEAWMWLGLYEGYPCFRSGRTEPVAVAALLVAFVIFAVLVGWIPAIRRRMPLGGVMVAGLFACMASSACVVLHLGSGGLSDQALRWIVRGLCFVMGASTALLFLGFGTRASRLAPVQALLGFCFSFGAAFFAFFAVSSLDYPYSDMAFSLLPVISAVCLWERADIQAHAAPRSSSSDASKQEEGQGATAFGRVPRNPAISAGLVSSEGGHTRYARGFVQMIVAFGVFAFAASFTQSFEPAKDFALGIDEGWVGFSLVLGVIAWILLTDGSVRTFKILKILYQAAIVLMVLKLVLQPLLTDDSAFAALNVMTYLGLFTVFWSLTAFVGHVGEVDPVRAFALVFGVGALCMAAGWVIGSHCYAELGRDRLYLSIAAGCVVAVFCTFGFSVRNFPYLTLTGRGRRRAEGGRGAEEGASAAVPPAPRLSLEEIVAQLAEECALTPREAEIFGLLAQGQTTEEIADGLVISYYTVRTHIRNLYAKLGATTRSELLLIISERERRNDS